MKINENTLHGMIYQSVNSIRNIKIKFGSFFYSKYYQINRPVATSIVEGGKLEATSTVDT